MNRYLVRAVGATAVLSLAVPAFAGTLDTPPTEPSPVPVAAQSSSNWTGGYVGLQFGYGELRDGLDGDSAIGGVTAGYDWDFGDWVVGVGADVNFGRLETSAGDLDSLTRLKVRGGYDFGNTLLYATTGASYAASSDLNDDWGYFAGVGIEKMLSDTVSLTGEVATHRFDSYRDYGRVNATTATIGVNYRF
ncbi:outer membrane protein [Tropicimonas marinistellae]|uniref:outer membrane protein n=1 Tax=Tropicimonas marinistellae TaxID=1739787 RepID=UPI0008366353|nr:porin family protein [Tropicimonas marinistellae]